MYYTWEESGKDTLRKLENLDESTDGAFGIDAHRLPEQSLTCTTEVEQKVEASVSTGRPRSPAPLGRGGAEGGVTQNKNVKNGQ